MIDFNFANEIVSSPTTIVSGRVSRVPQGIIRFSNNQDEVFPPQFFEINNGHFKALLHVSPGTPNRFEVQAFSQGSLNYHGAASNLANAVDSGSITLSYYPLTANKPVHLCVVVGSDSTGVYDMPRYKLDRGEVANLDTAIQRLKVAGRMMQAYTQDEFHQVGLSNRTFQFVEEDAKNKRLFGYDFAAAPHSEVKVHVLRSPLPVRELRKLDYAQQYPDAEEDGFLFRHALDLISKSDLIASYKRDQVPIQCAVMYLDSHWDSEYITAHAAIGGGSSQIKLAIFGSHGLHSYPLTFPQMNGSFLDNTPLTTREVANDRDECGTSWQCLNICMGAFMHEIGHLFGSPHQVDGVMFRDYVNWNRSFVTREPPVKSSKWQTVGSNGLFMKQCHWNKMDLIRYLYHASFSIPTDANDPTFEKLAQSRMQKVDLGPAPTLYVTEPGSVVIKSAAGIFMFVLCADDLGRHYVPFYPKSYQGAGLQHEIHLKFDEYLDIMKSKWEHTEDTFGLRVLSVAGDLYIDDFRATCFPSSDSIITHDFNLGRGLIDGYKSVLLGEKNGDLLFIGFDISRVYMVRVYHGGALDGISVYCKPENSHFQDNKPVPKRHYLYKLTGSKPSPADGDRITLGSITPDYSDFHLEEGEKITKFVVRNGAWVDALQIVTDKGRMSKMFGNASGGHSSTLEPPTSNHSIIGLYAYQGQWTDGLGIIYAAL